MAFLMILSVAQSAYIRNRIIEPSVNNALARKKQFGTTMMHHKGICLRNSEELHKTSVESGLSWFLVEYFNHGPQERKSECYPAYCNVVLKSFLISSVCFDLFKAPSVI